MTSVPAGVEVRTRPRLRGVSHQYAFFVSLAFGALLVFDAPTARARVGAAIFAASAAAMFGASAVYHRVTWQPRARRWMARVDHAAVYLLIAGTYTPFGLLVFSGTAQVVLLTVVWSGAAAAVALKWIWLDAPKWLAAVAGLGLGWIGLVALPEIVAEIGLGGASLVVAGGILYTMGAVIYALRRPDPFPSVFGYHELFHALVVCAAASQFAAVAFFVVPKG